jgi:hypothetical protein
VDATNVALASALVILLLCIVVAVALIARAALIIVEEADYSLYGFDGKLSRRSTVLVRRQGARAIVAALALFLFVFLEVSIAAWLLTH